MQAHTKPALFWITGLSGAGKTTIASMLKARLAELTPTVLLDGDQLREILGATESFARNDRRQLAHVYARLAQNLVAQGITVVCATISMFHDVRAWNRAHTANYFEVYLKVPLAELQARDPKGHYKRQQENDTASAAGSHNVVGLQEPFEEPLTPDIVIENFGNTSPAQTLDAIWQAYTKRDKGSAAL